MSAIFDEAVVEQKGEQAPVVSAPLPTRAIFAHQTGQALVTLGMIFKHVPPFNESIEAGTSDTLIAIGKKLKGLK